jgi:CRP-like cAMP-binding protein
MITEVPVLDRIPGLAASLPAADLAEARNVLRADVVTMSRGEHDLALLSPDGILGLLVLDGWFLRHAELGGRTVGVLAGPGSFVRPRRATPRVSSIPIRVGWRAIHTTRVAVIGPEIAARAARWPGFLGALLALAFERAQLESFSAVIRALVHVELRLQALMWFYADLYGHQVAEGTVLPVRLGHLDLAELTASRRPSVSSHLVRLADRQEIVRLPDRTWLLRGGPVSVEDLRVRVAAR